MSIFFLFEWVLIIIDFLLIDIHTFLNIYYFNLDCQVKITNYKYVRNSWKMLWHATITCAIMCASIGFQKLVVLYWPSSWLRPWSLCGDVCWSWTLHCYNDTQIWRKPQTSNKTNRQWHQTIDRIMPIQMLLPVEL